MTIEFNSDYTEYTDDVPVEEESDENSTEKTSDVAPFSDGGGMSRLLRTSFSPDIPRPETASELMAQYPNLSLASIGIMLMVDMSYEKMEAEYATVELLRQTSKKMREDIISGNNNLLKAIEKIGEDNTNKKAGIGPSGKIVADNASFWDKAWKWLVAIAVLLVVAFAQFIPYLGQILLICLIAAIMFGSQVINLLINVGVINENSQIAKDIAEICSLLNPIYLVLDILLTVTIIILEKTGAISKEQAQKARIIGAIVIQILAIVIMIIASIVATVFTGGAATPAIVANLMMLLNAISAILGIANSIFTILKSVKQLQLADAVFECDKMKAALESMRVVMQNLTSTIDLMTQALKSDSDTVTMEFSNMAEIVKRESDTKASIARNITI
jgi:hypothetical protein